MIKLDGHALNLSDLWKIAMHKESCALTDESKHLMTRSRDFVEKLAKEKRAIYGINTGFGPLSGERVSPEDLDKHQVHLLHHLSCGQGALYTEVETRASMLARVNALARGFSGIRVETVELLINALNEGILPEIPSEGSVGASGDLVPLAHLSRMLIGLGKVRYKGKQIAAKEAFKQAGLSTTTLKTKEGLALVNGTSIMTGVAALSVCESQVVLGWMEFLSSCLIQAMYGEPEVMCAQLHKARGHRGQFVSAHRMAEHLKTHPKYKEEIEEHRWGSHAKPLEKGLEIQDPYSLRCTPQILGAFQDGLWHIEDVVQRELNATTDNPLIFPNTESVIHGGNFYGQHVSYVSDYLKIGLIKLALLSERQTERLLNWRYSQGLPPLLTGAAPGINTGFGGVGLLATSLAAECRMLGTPASIQSIPTNANNQDVVSMGSISAKQTRVLLPLVWKLIGIQGLVLAQAVDLRKDNTLMGEDFKKMYNEVRNISPMLKEDRPLDEDIQGVTALFQDENFQNQLLPKRPSNPLSINLGPIDA